VTFALLGGLGGVIGLLARQYGFVMPAMLLGAALIMLVFGHFRSMSGPADLSITSLVAALLTLCFGMLATSGQPALAMAAAAVVTLILALRTGLHGLIRKLGEEDVIALARFAIIAGPIWPFLPNTRYGPYDAWKAGATRHFALRRIPGTIPPCAGAGKTVGAEAFWSGFRLVAVF
jgi:uncharacterized membrane protein (DUF4010 family)